MEISVRLIHVTRSAVPSANQLSFAKSALQAWVRNSLLRDHGLESASDPDKLRAQAAALKRIRVPEREKKILREAAAYPLAGKSQAWW